MAVMVPREKWSDDRLDDLNQKVDDGFTDVRVEMRNGFTRVDGEIKELRQEMNQRFNSIDARFNAIDTRFNSIEARFEALNRNLLTAAVAVIVTLVSVNAF